MLKFCTLFSGSSGNCIYIGCDDTNILIDAGVSGIKVERALKEIGLCIDRIDAVVVSHEHIDHVRGVGILARRHGIDVYATEGTWECMPSSVGDIDYCQRKGMKAGDEMVIGSITIKSFGIPHDAAEPVGFNIYGGDKRVTIATDIGCIDNEMLLNFKGSDLVLLEANHDINMLRVGPYPYSLKRRILGDRGHLSNDRAGEVISYLLENGTRKVLLGHLSKENNFPELAYRTVMDAVQGFKEEFTIEVAKRDSVGELVQVI